MLQSKLLHPSGKTEVSCVMETELPVVPVGAVGKELWSRLEFLLPQSSPNATPTPGVGSAAATADAGSPPDVCVSSCSTSTPSSPRNGRKRTRSQRITRQRKW